MGKLSLFVWVLAIAMPVTGFADQRASCAMLLQAIPLHDQETDYTCGAACTRSLLQYFRGKKFSEEQIAQVLGTHLLGYTPARNIQYLFAHFALNSQIDTGLSVH